MARGKSAGHESASGPTGRIVTVYRGRSDDLRHARCRQALEFRRRRGLEVDFYCRTCCEHVSLPEHVLSRVPPLVDLDLFHGLVGAR